MISLKKKICVDIFLFLAKKRKKRKRKYKCNFYPSSGESLRLCFSSDQQDFWVVMFVV